MRPLPVAAAVELFAQRAATARPGFAVTDGNYPAVAKICRAIDGLPLAVELAAARMRVLTPSDLAARLDRSLDVLAGGPHDLPARHRSLRATIESSLEVVPDAARTLFAWLGAFPGGCLLADLEAVATALDRDGGWLLAALTDLVDMSLVRVTEDSGAARYVLPDAMRELAVERLGAGHRVRHAVAVHYLRRVPAEDADNVRAATAWALAHEPELLGPATVEALCRYYEVSGRLAEGQAALARAGEAGEPTAWTSAGRLARLRGDLDEAARLAGVALARLDPADHVALCAAHLLLGSVGTDRRDGVAARSTLRVALRHARKAADTRLVGRVLNNLGTLSMELGRLRDAERLLSAALVAKRRSGSGDLDSGRTLFNLAETALAGGEAALAASRALEAGKLLRRAGYDRLAGFYRHYPGARPAAARPHPRGDVRRAPRHPAHRRLPRRPADRRSRRAPAQRGPAHGR